MELFNECEISITLKLYVTTKSKFNFQGSWGCQSSTNGL